jgi:hypothetical protein
MNMFEGKQIGKKRKVECMSSARYLDKITENP